MTLPTVLDDFLRALLIKVGGTLLPKRTYLNFIGLTVVDNEANDSTDVTGSGGAYPVPIGGVPPDPSSLTWVQRAGLVSGNASFVADGNGQAFTLISPPVGDNDLVLHALVTSAPAAPYTFTIGVLIDGLVNANNFRAGLVLRESATGKILHLCLTDQLSGTGVESWTTALAQASQNYISGASPGALNAVQLYNGNASNVAPLYFRVRNDGTNLFWSRSTSGALFTPYALSSSDGVTPLGIAKNDFFTTGPDQIGIAVGEVYQSAPPIAIRVFSWTVTSP